MNWGLFRRNIVERLCELEPTLVEKLRAQKVPFEELIMPDEIHDLLRWSDWVGAYRTIAEFFGRRLTASDERQWSPAAALQDFHNFCR